MAANQSHWISTLRGEGKLLNEGLMHFEKFSQLPAEIRRLIWGYCLPISRNVELYHNISSNEMPKVIYESLPMLSTCREAREAALERYTVPISTSDLAYNLYGGGVPFPATVVWIDPNTDVLMISFNRYLFTGIFAVKHISVNARIIGHLMLSLGEFSNLQSLRIVWDLEEIPYEPNLRLWLEILKHAITREQARHPRWVLPLISLTDPATGITHNMPDGYPFNMESID